MSDKYIKVQVVIWDAINAMSILKEYLIDTEVHDMLINGTWTSRWITFVSLDKGALITLAEDQINSIRFGEDSK